MGNTRSKIIDAQQQCVVNKNAVRAGRNTVIVSLEYDTQCVKDKVGWED